jgi:predicted PP-loop superfamily ATPase
VIDQAFSAHADTIISDDQLSFGWECLYIDDKISTRLILESLFL